MTVLLYVQTHTHDPPPTPHIPTYPPSSLAFHPTQNSNPIIPAWIYSLLDSYVKEATGRLCIPDEALRSCTSGLFRIFETFIFFFFFGNLLFCPRTLRLEGKTAGPSLVVTETSAVRSRRRREDGIRQLNHVFDLLSWWEDDTARSH